MQLLSYMNSEKILRCYDNENNNNLVSNVVYGLIVFAISSPFFSVNWKTIEKFKKLPPQSANKIKFPLRIGISLCILYQSTPSGQNLVHKNEK